MAALIQFALTQRTLVLLVTLLLTGGGYIAFRALPIDAFPDVSPTQVKIIVKAPGMTPEEVESRITAPIEVELLGIPNQVMLRSIAKYALTDITVDFRGGHRYLLGTTTGGGTPFCCVGLVTFRHRRGHRPNDDTAR